MLPQSFLGTRCPTSQPADDFAFGIIFMQGAKCFKVAGPYYGERNIPMAQELGSKQDFSQRQLDSKSLKALMLIL